MENPGICLHLGTIRTDIQNSVLENLSLFSSLSSASLCVNGSLSRKCFPSTPDLRKIGHSSPLNLLIRPSDNYPLLHSFPHNSQQGEEDARNSSQVGNQMAPLPTINQDTALCWHLRAVGYSLVPETLLRCPAFSSFNWRWWILKSQPWLIDPINFRDRRGRQENKPTS